MASRSTEKSYGYEDDRFEKHIDEHFHCSICYNVLREPRMCKNNDHVFCLDCITEHLTVNSECCPQCKDHLSVDTLRRPRVVISYLSKLKTNCENASRGCPEFICVEDLEKHIEDYDSPVLCSNDACGKEINKRDKVHQEGKVCEYTEVKRNDCEKIQQDVKALKGGLVEVSGKIEATNKEMKKVMGRLEEMNKDMKEEVENAKEKVSMVSNDVEEVKIMMSEMLVKLNMVELLYDGIFNSPKVDIMIAGGYGCSRSSPRSAEIYSWERYGWFNESGMNEQHLHASSFIYNNQLFVVGGDTKAIESMDLKKSMLLWTKFHGELPFDSCGHQTVVYQQRVIHIGGHGGYGIWSSAISELQLTSPCTMEELCKMPEPRAYHSAEIFENKVLILGGKNDGDVALDSVLEFDVENKKCNKKPSLPRALTGMATVRWRDKVVVLGGYEDINQGVSNDVFMYDFKTGETTALPSMLQRRYDCCAVITGDTIVVMGGQNTQERLKSVECFTMGSSTWECLPAMDDVRICAVANVLPSTRKYV